jgi:hypothetical protein
MKYRSLQFSEYRLLFNDLIRWLYTIIWGNILGLKYSHHFARYLLHAGLLLGLFLNPEDGGNICLRNVDDFQRTTRRYIPEDRTPEMSYLRY